MLASIRQKVVAAERLTPAEGEWLLTSAPLTALGEMAAAERFRRHPAREVTYVIDSNPNYTNVCNVDCVFCAFYRHAGDSGAYTHSVEEVLEKGGWAVMPGKESPDRRAVDLCTKVLANWEVPETAEMAPAVVQPASVQPKAAQ